VAPRENVHGFRSWLPRSFSRVVEGCSERQEGRRGRVRRKGQEDEAEKETDRGEPCAT